MPLLAIIMQNNMNNITIKKWRITYLKKLVLKIVCLISFEISFNDIIKFGDFDFDNILIDENSHKNILIYFI